MKSVFFIFLLFSHLSVLPQQPTIILYNGKIFTADDKQLYVEAIAITGNKVSAIGKNADIGKLAGANTQKIDLQGKTVIPGINDAHYHNSPYLKARTIGYPNDGREPGWQEVKDSIEVAVATTPRVGL